MRDTIINHTGGLWTQRTKFLLLAWDLNIMYSRLSPDPKTGYTSGMSGSVNLGDGYIYQSTSTGPSAQPTLTCIAFSLFFSLSL